MAEQAWASLVLVKNFPAILSEAGGKFDREFLERWVIENGDGYFVRDPGSSLDCSLFPTKQFYSTYRFEHEDVGTLFRLISRLGR